MNRRRTPQWRQAPANASSRMRGFTAIEMVIVMAVAFVITAMTVIELQPLLQEERANAALDQLVGQLRSGREYSISKRRAVQVQFLGNNTVQITAKNSLIPGAGADVILSTLPLEGTVQFMLFPNVPDTPDGFGNAAPIEFAGVANGPAQMLFQSDGTFVDGGTGNPINGSVFLGVPGTPNTARAATVLGATGRIRPYKATPTGWIK